MSSIRTIAERAGVSPATVSRTLNGAPHVSAAIRDKVVIAAKQVNYQLPRTAGTGSSTHRLGLLYSGTPVNAEPGGFDAAVLNAAVQSADQNGYDFTVANLRRDLRSSENYKQLFRRKGIDAAVMRVSEGDRELACRLGKEKLPVIVLADRIQDAGIGSIYSESYGTSVQAVRHLIDLGHTRIALCVHLVRDRDHDDRRRAYHDALAAAGLEAAPELTVEVIADMAGGASALCRLMSQPQPPTAIFFTDPLASFGAMRRAHELRLEIPRELSIVGFDDGGLRRLAFPLYTCVVQDAAGMVARAIEWLTAADGGSAEAFQERLPTTFEVNHSTAAPPAKPIRVMPDGARVPPRHAET